MSGSFSQRRAILAVALAGVLSTVAAGCAGGADRRPATRRWWPEWPGTTIGSDLRQAPPGVTIPPPSWGVDIVSTESAADGDVERAVLPVKTVRVGKIVTVGPSALSMR